MRMIVMLLLGLAIGVLGAVTIIGGMKQDVPYARAVMALTSQHFGALRKMEESQQCDAAQSVRHLRSLRALADDLAPAFLPTGGDDAQFQKYGSDYAARLDTALASVPATCTALRTAIINIGAGCKACHQDFKP
jgi:cytochrome c556